MNAMSPDPDFAPYELASPSMLSMQPITEPEYEEGKDWTDIFSHLESRLGQMRVVRYSWWTYWSTLAQYLLPRRYRWLISANLLNKGDPINQSIVDSTGTLAMNICAAGLVDGVMPSTRPWVKLRIGAPGVEIPADVKEWLEDTEERLYTVLGQSNFYDTMAQIAQDEVTFGTAPAIVYEDVEDVIRVYNPCAGEYYLASSSRFTVDTIYREFVLTVLEIVEMFGVGNCPRAVVELFQAGGGSLENEFVVAHAIEPNFPIAARGAVSKRIDVVKGPFAFREVYWLKGVKTEKELSRRGFYEKPFAVARWSKVANDAYGRGPGMDALGDVKQLQLQTLRKAEGIEKQVRPPMVADVSMKNEPSSILPGHITYVSTEAGTKKPGFWPAFEVKPDLQGMVADLNETQQRINRAFLVDVFMAISQMEGVQPRNDLEIVERRAEKLQRLGPVIGLWKSEFASILIERILSIMDRRQLLRPRPPSMQGLALKFDYMDVVTMAQIASQTTTMERTFAMAGKLSEAAKAAGVPDPLRIFNLDQSARIYSEKVKFPTEGLFTEDQVAEHDQARQNEVNQQKAMQATAAGVQAAEGLSKVDVGGGQTAVQAMLGRGP